MRPSRPAAARRPPPVASGPALPVVLALATLALLGACSVECVCNAGGGSDGCPPPAADAGGARADAGAGFDVREGRDAPAPRDTAAAPLDGPPDAPPAGKPDAPAPPDAPPTAGADTSPDTALDTSGAAPDAGPVAACPVSCPDGTTCVTDEVGLPLAAACVGGVVRMRPLVAACGVPEAVALALADPCGGLLPPGSARVLWFEAGGEYVIREPLVVDAPGVVLRGDGAPVVAVDPPDPRWQGSVLRCAQPAGEACVTLVRRADADLRAGFGYEGLTMVWEGAAAAADVVGLRLENADDAFVRDAVWDDWPGTALEARGVRWSRFADLTFVSPDDSGGTALSFACGPADEPGLPAPCPNGNVLSGLHVEGHATGVRYVSGNAVTIEASSFTNARRNAILADGVESLRIVGCRFMDVQAAPSEDSAYVRVQREEGWWYPDVTLDGVYFQCHCREGRWPVAASVVGTSATPAPRVLIRGSTFQNCPEGVLQRGDVWTIWQCADNRVIQKVAAGPSQYESWTLDDCGSPDDVPPWPETCVE